jgi:hypothetical protein
VGDFRYRKLHLQKGLRLTRGLRLLVPLLVKASEPRELNEKENDYRG